MLDLTKPVQTAIEGRKARFLGSLAGGVSRHVFAVQMDGGIDEGVIQVNDNGICDQYGRCNLINTPEPKRSGEVWVQVWLGLDGDLCCSAGFGKPSHETGLPNLVVKRVPWTEGEGMEGKL